MAKVSAELALLNTRMKRIEKTGDRQECYLRAIYLILANTFKKAAADAGVTP